MINTKIDEIQNEIRCIEREREEGEQYIRNLQCEEECSYDGIQTRLRCIADEFEACQGDPHLTCLVEEKLTRLQELERECGEFIMEIQQEQGKMRYQCECDIDDLKREIHTLSMGGM